MNGFCFIVSGRWGIEGGSRVVEMKLNVPNLRCHLSSTRRCLLSRGVSGSRFLGVFALRRTFIPSFQFSLKFSCLVFRKFGYYLSRVFFSLKFVWFLLFRECLVCLSVCFYELFSNCCFTDSTQVCWTSSLFWLSDSIVPWLTDSF